MAVVSSYDLCGQEQECQVFFRDTISLIVAANHPWVKRDYIAPADLLDEKLIIREPTSGTRRVLITVLAK